MSLDNQRGLIGGGRSRIGIASSGLLRVVLLFGSAAVALALLLAPILDNGVSYLLARGDAVQGLDMMHTGTIGSRSTTYTIRKSVLQAGPNSVCIMRSNGTSSGDC